MHREGLTISVTRKASELPSKPGEWGQELGDPAARQGAGSPGAVETARRTSLLPSGLSEGPHAGVQSGTATSGFGELPTRGHCKCLRSITVESPSGDFPACGPQGS